MDRFRIQPFDRADAAYKLRKRFRGTRAVETASDDDRVVVFDASAKLEKLDLDWHDLDKQLRVPDDDSALLGVVVLGDLVVDTAITNYEMDYGPFLYVRGSVTAGDVGVGGSEIEIEGDLTVARTLFGFYNHGRMVVSGLARAQVILVEEYRLRFDGGVEAHVAKAGNFLRVGTPASKVKVAHWFGTAYGANKKPIRGTGDPAALSRRDLASGAFDCSDCEELPDGENWLDHVCIDRKRTLEAISKGRPLLAKKWPLVGAAAKRTKRARPKPQQRRR